jgi:hypothetical protein
VFLLEKYSNNILQSIFLIIILKILNIELCKNGSINSLPILYYYREI